MKFKGVVMRILFAFITFFTLLLAQDIYEPFYKLKPHQLEDTSCKEGKKSKLCLHKELIYPDSSIVVNSVKTVLDLYTHKALTEYKKEQLSNYLEDVDLDNDPLFSGDYEYRNRLALFDYTDPIVTLSMDTYSYQGGAHGIEVINFINYDIDRKKELHLDDIVDFKNKEFMKIAEIAYRKSDHLLPNESLVEAGWMDDKFILSENFAVTTKGLLFHYNPYEIKSFAAGMTEFIIPYYKIEPFLRHKRLLELAKKDKKAKRVKKQFQIKNGTIYFTIEQLDTKEFKIDIDVDAATHLYQRVWFSLSFPQFQTTKYITKLQAKSVRRFKLYDIGSKIYSKETGLMKSKYPLLEAESQSSNFSLSFKVQVPKNVPYICINYRVTTFHDNLLKDDENLEYYDQQGFRVKRICLEK